MNSTILSALITAVFSVIAIVVGLQWRRKMAQRRFKDVIVETEIKDRLAVISVAIKLCQLGKNEVDKLSHEILANKPITHSVSELKRISEEFDEAFSKSRSVLREEYKELHGLQHSLRIFSGYEDMFYSKMFENEPEELIKLNKTFREELTEKQSNLLQIKEEVIKRI